MEEEQQEQKQDMREEDMDDAGRLGVAATEDEGEEEGIRQKRVKTAAEELDKDDMVIDGKAGAETTEGEEEEGGEGEEQQLQKELEEYFRTAESKPHAADVQAFLENPLLYHPNSPCLAGTVDNENNTALILAIKSSSEKCVSSVSVPFFLSLRTR